MFSLRVESSALVRGRLNAEAYSPEHVAADRALKHSRLDVVDLASFVTSPINNSIRDVSDFLDAPGATVPMFRPADISEGWCSLETAPRLPKVFEDRHVKSRVAPGDIVVGIAGSIGVVGRVPAGIVHGNINGSSARLVLSGDDAGFVLAYLLGRFGQSAMVRFAVGAVQRHLNLEDLPGVAIVKPEGSARKYIGALVGKAEALRLRMRAIVEEVDAAYRRVETQLPTNGRRHARIPQGLLRDRLDAGHYPDAVVRAFEHRHNDVATLGSLCVDIFSGATLMAADEGVRQATVATLDAVFLKEKYRTVLAPKNDGRRFVTHDLAIAAAAHTATYIGKEVTYVVIDAPAFPSTEVLVLRPDRTRVPSSWVWAFLRSRLGYCQIQACVRGITAHAYPDDLKDVVVPLPSSACDAQFRAFDPQLVEASGAARGAADLVTAARLLVEALIEGKVTEADLITAAGDTAADRALLTRLTAAGVDAPGDPIFPDLDALEALLKPEDP